MSEFHQFIKAVGTGPKGNRDLSFEESKIAMDMILSGKASQNQIAAFLIGWRLKPETIEEYRGALESIHEKTQGRIEDQDSFELGFPFDGKNDSPYLFALSAKLLKKFSMKIVVTGDYRVPSKGGVTVKEIMDKIGPIDNVEYFDRENYLPELSRLHSLRNDLGLRCAFNTLEKFSGIKKSKFGATGVFHKPYVAKYSEIFKDKLDRFMLVSSNEGGPELYKKGKVWVVTEGEMEELSTDPKDFGINLSGFDKELSLEDMLAITRDPDLDHMKMAALNSSLYLYTSGRCEKWQDCYELIIRQF